MKKLVLFAAVIVAVSFASCKQKAAQEPVVEPAIEAVEEAAAVEEEAAAVEEGVVAVEEAAAAVEEAVAE